MNLITKITKFREDQLYCIRQAPIFIPENSVFAGFEKEDAWEKTVPPAGGDFKHFPMGIEWKRGYLGIADKARERMSRGDLTAEQYETLRGVVEVYEEMVQFAQRHVDAIDPADESKKEMRENLIAITQGPPQTLAQALQLYFLIWRIRSIRIHPYVSTCTFGRMDQHLYEYFKADVEAGRLTHESAVKLIEDFFRKLNRINSGDTLMTWTLSGTDINGEDQTNELSYVMLEASYNVSLSEPHISVRLSRKTPKDFRELVFKRLMTGHAQPAMYFDETVIPELVNAGIPKEYAVRYCSNGCSEIILDGCGKIMFRQPEAVKALELVMYNGTEVPLPGEPIGYYWTFNYDLEYDVTESVIGYRTGDPVLFERYEELEAAYIEQYNYQLDHHLRLLVKQRRDELAYGVSHPLLNGTLTNTLENGFDMYRGGLPPYGTTIFSGSLPTAADGLAALKKVVFDDKLYTMQEVITAMRANFEGYDELRAALLAAPKFGNDDDYVDLIAKRLADNFIARVNAYSKEVGIIIDPILLAYLFLKESRITGATPDGRRWKDPICVHFGPTPGRAVNGPTAVLKSVAKTSVKYAFGSGEIQLELPPFSDYDKGLAVLNTLVNYAHDHEFNMLSIGIYDVERLRAAQRDPENNADIIVRVFGYNARFIDMADQLQEHVIQRILNEQ